MISLIPIAFSALITAQPSAQSVAAQPAPDSYRRPPEEIAKLADAPLTPALRLSPDQAWALLTDTPTLLPLSDLAQPELKLAGHRFNPQNDDQTRSPYAQHPVLLRISDGSQRPIAGLPDQARLRYLTWSPDAKRIAIAVSTENALELWVADVGTARARQIPGVKLNAVHPSPPMHWVSDSKTLICRTVAEDRGTAPAAPPVPSSPVVDESIEGRKSPAHTYQDLLKSPYQAALFEYHLTSRVRRVTVDGESVPLGKSGGIVRADPSPDGKFLLVESIHRPFSYIVPEERFPRRIEIWDLQGNLVKQIADLPLADQVPVNFDAVRTGPRQMGWRADAPAVLFWAEAQDGGDPRAEAAVRDRLFMLAAPFDQAPVAIASLAMRFRNIVWGNDRIALVSEWRWKDRRTREWRLAPGNPSEKPQLLFDRSSEDRYHDPGLPALRRNSAGYQVLRIGDQGKSLFFVGQGASPEGDRPFVDRLDLATVKTVRLWQSQPPHYEEAIELLDDRADRLITRRESVSQPPNYFLRDVRKNALTALTKFPHPTPQLAEVKKELLRYQRADGVKLTATLYTPPKYSSKDGPLPMLMWAYPIEFKSADAAGQVTTSPHRFIRVTSGSPLFWLVRGYAILDNPTFPIVGEGDKESNDTYVQQLVDGAKAAVDEVVRRGVADRNRIAIGGHSYGAFTTANLLAHSDLFRAGIARSGAYNRTLTPFGFQREERTFWDAPETYIKMSPFAYANKIDEPILMIHGMEDANSGTYPIQSERLFAALKGFGRTARLVMLPHESHGYRARESVMHMLWEMDAWLEKYVKNAAPRKVVSTSGDAQRSQ
ncbi:MAG TPA: prolyl oligopeptidase family serine peptidase [Myxococcaceae bacterium]|nr:prolyl oligopeptidase family serine peptidase [Myxococcaceae bacterium]